MSSWWPHDETLRTILNPEVAGSRLIVIRGDACTGIGTVKKAIELLRTEGLVRTVIGRAIFVSRPGG
jgi:hypothetical protein